MHAGFGLLSCAYAVPSSIRYNDDPVFASLAHQAGWDSVATFTGLAQRRVLATDEVIETYMVQAGQAALAGAGVAAGAIDRVYGYASVPAHMSPNGLFRVHQELGLSQQAWVLPINVEFSTFLAALVLASEAGSAQACGHALVAIGSNWTRHLDYSKGHAFTAGDAAAAAVVGPGAGVVLRDYAFTTFSDLYTGLTMSIRPLNVAGYFNLPLDQGGLPRPMYRMDDQLGPVVYGNMIREGLPELVMNVLKRSRVPASDITLITHQGSRELLDYWDALIRPAVYADSLSELGNMTSATYPVNLARALDDLRTTFVVLAAVGTGAHLGVVVLERR